MSVTAREFDFEAGLLPGGLSPSKAKEMAAKRAAIRGRASAEKALTSEQFTRSRMRGRGAKEMMLDAFEARNHGKSAIALQRFLTKYHTSARASLDDFLGLLGRAGMDSFPRSELEALFDSYKASPREETIELDRFVRELGSMLNARVTADNTLELTTSSSALGAKQRTLKNLADVERSRDSSDLTEDEAEELLFEKLTQRLPQGALALERAFRKVASIGEGQMDNEATFEQFCTILRRLGLEGLSGRVMRDLFVLYGGARAPGVGGSGYTSRRSGGGTTRRSGGGTTRRSGATLVSSRGRALTYAVLVEKMAQRYARSRKDELGGLARQIQLSRKTRETHMTQSTSAAALQPVEERKVDLHSLLLEKVEQRIHGEHQLRRCFRRFDGDSDWSKLSFPEFRDGLRVLGLQNISDVIALAYFKRFDSDGAGMLDFRKLARALMPGLPRPKIHSARAEAQDQDDNEHHHCRHRRHRRHRHDRHGRRQCRHRTADGESRRETTARSARGGAPLASQRSYAPEQQERTAKPEREPVEGASARFTSVAAVASPSPTVLGHCESAPSLGTSRTPDLRFQEVPAPRVAQHSSY